MTALFLSLLLQPTVVTRTYLIDGVSRKADIYLPTVKTTNPPLVFGFHGHGGNSKNAARSFKIQELWPEAVVVYMQGLPTATQKVDPEGKRSGWQIRAGENNDRDIKFFGSVYAEMGNDFLIDPNRVYALGHSNGGRFTYVLMQQHGDLFAAFAPSGSPAPLTGMPKKPVFHIAGEKDPLVKFIGQKLTLDKIKSANGCQKEGRNIGTYATFYEGENGNDVVAYFHPGGHEYPREEAPQMIVDFFKAHVKK